MKKNATHGFIYEIHITKKMGSMSQDCGLSQLFPINDAQEVLVGSSCKRLGIAAMGSTCCKRKGLGEGGPEPRGGGTGLGSSVL